MTVDHLGTVPEVRPSAAPALGVVPPGALADPRAFTEGLFALVRAAKEAVGQVIFSVPGLDEAALEAVRQWEFTPTLINGVPTPVTMTLAVQFVRP